MSSTCKDPEVRKVGPTGMKVSGVMGELYQIGLDISGGLEIDYSVRHVLSFVSGNRITDGIDKGHPRSIRPLECFLMPGIGLCSTHGLLSGHTHCSA